MTRPLVTFAAAATLAACASAPDAAHAPDAPSASAARDCSQLDADLARARADRIEAQAREESAWKVLFPVAVVAKYARGKSALEAADKRIDALQAQAGQQGCVQP